MGPILPPHGPAPGGISVAGGPGGELRGAWNPNLLGRYGSTAPTPVAGALRPPRDPDAPEPEPEPEPDENDEEEGS